MCVCACVYICMCVCARVHSHTYVCACIFACKYLKVIYVGQLTGGRIISNWLYYMFHVFALNLVAWYFNPMFFLSLSPSVFWPLVYSLVTLINLCSPTVSDRTYSQNTRVHRIPKIILMFIVFTGRKSRWPRDGNDIQKTIWSPSDREEQMNRTLWADIRLW